MGFSFDCESPRSVEDVTPSMTAAGRSRAPTRSESEADFLRLLMAMQVDSDPGSAAALQVRVETLLLCGRPASRHQCCQRCAQLPANAPSQVISQGREGPAC
jgi:hypothetical protein